MKKGACSGRRLHWPFGQWIRTSCPLTVLFCTHVTELETQIHVRICARSGALIASAIRLSQCLHPTRPLQGATLVRHTPLAGSSGLSRAVGAGFHVVPVLPGLTARNTPYPLQARSALLKPIKHKTTKNPDSYSTHSTHSTSNY